MLLHVTGLCCKQNYYLYSSLNVEVCKLFLSNWKWLCWLILMLTNVICHVSTNIPGGSKLISIRESLNLVTSTWKLDELMAFCGEDNKNNCNQNEINVLLIFGNKSAPSGSVTPTFPLQWHLYKSKLSNYQQIKMAL